MLILNWLWRSFFFSFFIFIYFWFFFFRIFVCSRLFCVLRSGPVLTDAAHGTGSFWRCFVVWNTKGGTVAKSTFINRKNVVEFLKKSIAVMVSADRQSVGDETIWQQKGIGQGTNTSEDSRTLGHSSMQLIQVILFLFLVVCVCVWFCRYEQRVSKFR